MLAPRRRADPARLQALGFTREAAGLARFVQRCAAGRASDLQVLLGTHGERRLAEQTLQHLEGYRGSGPVRIGNAASRQLQLDVYGELMQVARRLGGRGRPEGDGLRLVPADHDDQDALAAGPRPDPRRGPAARLRPPPWHLHPGIRLG